MGKDRVGKYFFEKTGRFVTLESQGGTFDRALSSDCRSYGREAYDINPWTAMSMIDCGWGEDVLSPWGLPEGDYPNPDKVRMSEDGLMIDDFGRPIFFFDEEENDDLWHERHFLTIEENDSDASEEYDGNVKNGFQHKFDGDNEFFHEIEEQQNVFDFIENTSHNHHEAVEEYDSADPHEYLLRRGSRANLVLFKTKENKKDDRACNTHKSFSHGKRGDNFYKIIRRNRIRVSRRTHEKLASGINDEFSYKLLPGQKQRVAIVGSTRRCRP